MSNEEEYIENVSISKEEIDKLESAVEDLRDCGFACVYVGGKPLGFCCDELVKNREEFENFLKKSELTDQEVFDHIEKLNKKTKK